MLVLRSIYDLSTRVVALKISIVCVIFNTPVWYENPVSISLEERVPDRRFGGKFARRRALAKIGSFEPYKECQIVKSHNATQYRLSNNVKNSIACTVEQRHSLYLLL